MDGESKLVAYGADVYQEIAVGVERPQAVEADLTSSRRILAVNRTAGEAEITGTRIRLEPLQAAIFEVSLGA